MNLPYKLTLILISVILLASCGGGGGNSPSPELDTDGDGIVNRLDKDDDNDGVEDVFDAFPLDRTEHTDTDSDGVGNNGDADDDNDNVPDINDAFPEDASEWKDTDSDGIGNNTDADDDNDNVPDINDAFPEDASESVDSDGDGTGNNADAYPASRNCHIGIDGDGLNCYLDILAAENFNDAKSYNNNFVYIPFAAQSKILRLNTQSGHFLSPIDINSSKLLTSFEFDIANNELYVAYTDGSISRISTVTGVENDFITQDASQLILAGNSLIVESDQLLYAYSKGGVQTDSVGFYKQSRSYSWDNENNRLYYFRDLLSPNDLLYIDVDQLTGEFGFEVDSPYHSSEGISPPIVLSENNKYVLLGSGRLYNKSDLSLEGSLGSTLVDASWQQDSGLITISSNAGFTDLKRWSNDFKILERIAIEGAPRLIAGSDSVYIIVSETINGLKLTTYIPSDDSDDDGVTNLLDAFPLDVAASLDSDNDSFPDTWNAGYNESDSTTGLLIDSFPNDSACWLVSHGDGQGACDFSATMPVFTPDQTVADANGVIYLFSSDNRAVYRWSTEAQSYLNPLYVGQSSAISTVTPNLMAYSSAHERLYFGYDTGELTYIDLLGNLREQAFANTPAEVQGLASVGNFVLAQDPSGAWNTHYIYDVNGFLMDSQEWNRYSREYAWNSVNNRVYFFRDGTSPNDIHYEEIDQVSGLISDEGESPYHSSANIQLPIKVINNGQDVLLGSGKIYSADTLSLDHDITISIQDAASYNNVMVTSRTASTGWWLEVFDFNNFQMQANFLYDSEILSIHKYNDTLVIVEDTANGFQFSSLNMGDNDGDQIPAWWEYFYGLSDENSGDALLDMDSDSNSNLAEYQNGTDPSVAN